LSQALTKFVESKSQSQRLSKTILDFLSKLVALIATILGCFVSYKAITHVSFFKEHKGIIRTILSVVVFCVLFYLLSGLVTSVLYIVIAIIILLICLVLAAAHVISFIDEKYPEVKEEIIAYFTGKKEKPIRKVVRENISNMESWLSNLVFIQMLGGEVKLELVGSFVEGYDFSFFEIEPDEKIDSHWKNIDDRILIPVKASLKVKNTENNETAEVINVQAGLVVIKKDESIEYKKFDYKGYQILGASLVQEQAAKQKELIEEQKKWLNELKVFNSQSL
jgi:hypothetical protein